MIEGPYDNTRAYQLDYLEGDYSLERSEDIEFTSRGIQHIVVEGETLQSISNKYYGSSSRWSDIADYNGIIDPFDLSIGNLLIIPM